MLNGWFHKMSFIAQLAGKKCLVIGAGVTYILTRPNPEPAVIVQPAPGTQTPIVLQPGQRIVCNSSYQVYSSRYGAYETKQDCWIQQN